MHITVSLMFYTNSLYALSKSSFCQWGYFTILLVRTALNDGALNFAFYLCLIVVYLRRTVVRPMLLCHARLYIGRSLWHSMITTVLNYHFLGPVRPNKIKISALRYTIKKACSCMTLVKCRCT